MNGNKWKYFLLVPGFYYFLTGVWPLLHIESFMWVTGPKTDIWLVKTFGALVAALGLAFISPIIFNKRKISPVFIITAAGVALLASESYYVVKGVIPPIYLIDAVLQIIFIVILLKIAPKEL